MALSKPKQKNRPKTPFTIRSLSVTQPDATVLDRLAREALDYIGWTVSGSATVRALLRYADHQDEAWCREQLFSLIEQEIQTGTVWGKKK